MASDIRHFEDLDCWKVAKELANQVYDITKQASMVRDIGLVDQFRRAAVSIMNNIAEGFERGSNKDFCKFLFYSRGSAGEVRSMLYLALDQKYITEKQFDELQTLCIRSSQLCWGLIKRLQTT